MNGVILILSELPSRKKIWKYMYSLHMPFITHTCTSELKLLRNTKLIKAMDYDKITQERKTTKQTLTHLGDLEHVREKN